MFGQVMFTRATETLRTTLACEVNAVHCAAISIALLRETATRVTRLRKHRTCKLGTEAAKIEECSRELMLYFEQEGETEASMAHATRLLTTAVGAFRLVVDLHPKAKKGAIKKMIRFFGCKQAAQALAAANSHLINCMFLMSTTSTMTPLRFGNLSHDVISRLKPLAEKPAGAEAMTFWDQNGFGEGAAVSKVVGALYDHALENGRLPEDVSGCDLMGNHALTALLTSDVGDKGLVSVQRFASFVGEAACLCDALEPYLQVDGAPAAVITDADSMFAAEQALDDAVASLIDGDAGAPFRSATCIAIGAGGTGKTSARRAIQGERATPTRVSTVGGECDGLVVRLKHGDAAFATAADCGLTNAERAVRDRMETGRTGLDVDEDEADDLSSLVTDLDAFCAVEDMQRKHAEKAAELVAVTMGVSLDPVSKSAQERETAGVDQAAAHKTDSLATALTNVDTITLADPLTTGAEHGCAEQIQANQEYGKVLTSFVEREGVEGHEVVRVNFYDMGGQPEFWPLVGGFIRRYVQQGGLEKRVGAA